LFVIFIIVLLSSFADRIPRSDAWTSSCAPFHYDDPILRSRANVNPVHYFSARRRRRRVPVAWRACVCLIECECVCVFARVVIIVDVGLPTTRTLLAQLILSPTTRRYNSIHDVIDEQGKPSLNVISLFVIVMFGVCFDCTYTRPLAGYLFRVSMV